MTTHRHDLVVIGGGPGGMAVSDAAVRRGLDVAVIQDGPMGGDCTWTGCVPSKALITAAARGLDRAAGLAEAKRAIREVAALEEADVFRERGIAVHEGRGRFLTRTSIEITASDGSTGRAVADRIVIATGAQPLVPPIDGLRESDPLTSDSLWELDELPASLAVLGGGPIGIELAQALCRLGVEVTVFEGADQILGREEPETAELIAGVLEREGVEVRVGGFVQKVERLDDGRVVVHAPSGEPVTADEVLVGIGRTPVTAGLDVAAAGVRLDDRGNVVVDDTMATTAPGVYAVGDVTGKFPFTHGAYEQGLVAVANAARSGVRSVLPARRFDSSRVPFVTFADPQIARVGATEAEAFDAHGADARVVELPMRYVDRAIAEGRTEGFVKLIAGPGRVLGDRAGGQLLGATIVGPGAGELIHELSLAMRYRMPLGLVAMATHAYPTWGMAVQQAVAGFSIGLEHGTVRPARG